VFWESSANRYTTPKVLPFLIYQGFSFSLQRPSDWCSPIQCETDSKTNVACWKFAKDSVSHVSIPATWLNNIRNFFQFSGKYVESRGSQISFHELSILKIRLCKPTYKSILSPENFLFVPLYFPSHTRLVSDPYKLQCPAWKVTSQRFITVIILILHLSAGCQYYQNNTSIAVHNISNVLYEN
jgi:hypothetical protein